MRRRGSGQPVDSLNRPREFLLLASWRRAIAQSRRQLHLGSAGRRARRLDNLAGRLLLDGWQLSGENAFVTGDWADVILTTSDNFDFTGGDGGNGGCLAAAIPARTWSSRPRRRSRRRRRQSADRLVQHGSVPATLGTRRLRQRAAQRRPEAGHQQLEPRALQEHPDWRAAERSSSGPRSTTF